MKKYNKLYSAGIFIDLKFTSTSALDCNVNISLQPLLQARCRLCMEAHTPSGLPNGKMVFMCEIKNRQINFLLSIEDYVEDAR